MTDFDFDFDKMMEKEKIFEPLDWRLFGTPSPGKHLEFRRMEKLYERKKETDQEADPGEV